MQLYVFSPVFFIVVKQSEIVSKGHSSHLSGFHQCVYDYGQSKGNYEQTLGGKFVLERLNLCAFGCGGTDCCCGQRNGGTACTEMACTDMALHQCVFGNAFSDLNSEQRLLGKGCT